MTDAKWADIENLCDGVEELAEAVREAHALQRAAKVREDLVAELAEETRKLLAAVSGSEPGPAAEAPAPRRQKSRASVVAARPAPQPRPELREKRQALGLTQRQLSEKLGVTPAYVGLIETGRVNPSAETLGRIQKALGLPVTV